jgi:hypothetical protein
VAEALVAEDGKTVEPIGRLHLFAQAGKRWAHYQYTVGSWRVAERTEEGSTGSPPIETPQSWPDAPRPSEIIDVLERTVPEDGFASDGATNKSTSIQLMAIDTKGTSLAPQDWSEQRLDSESRHYFLFPGRFVFGSHRLEFYHPRTNGRIVRDDAKRRGQSGLDIHGTYSAADWPTETMLWIDPLRDDLPVEYVFRRMDAGAKQPTREQRVRITEHQQLPDGRWFPQRWEDEKIVDMGQYKSRVRRRYHATIDTKMRVDEKWLAEPMKQFRPTTRPALVPVRRPASGPASPPATATTQAAGAAGPTK